MTNCTNGNSERGKWKMSVESGGEQRNSALDKLKQRTPSLTDQHPNVLYTMPMQTVERLESILRSTLALQENIRSSMAELATKESLQPLATAEELLNWVNKVQELNREMYQSMRQVLREMREENRQAGKKRDEFLRTLSDMEQQLQRDGEDVLNMFCLWTPLTFIGAAAVSTVFTILMRILLR